MLIRIFLAACLCLSLTACASANYTAAEQKDHKAFCFEQAQDIYNAPVDVNKPYENALYVTCMKTQYGYDPDDLPGMH